MTNAQGELTLVTGGKRINMNVQKLTEKTLVQASNQRFKDGVGLLQRKQYNGSVLMFYYSTECLIKALIAKNSLDGTLRKEFFLHLDKYEVLVEAASLGKLLRKNPSLHDKLKILASLRHNEVRYNQLIYNEKDVSSYLKIVKEVRKWLKVQRLK